MNEECILPIEIFQIIVPSVTNYDDIFGLYLSCKSIMCLYNDRVILTNLVQNIYHNELRLIGQDPSTISVYVDYDTPEILYNICPSKDTSIFNMKFAHLCKWYKNNYYTRYLEHNNPIISFSGAMNCNHLKGVEKYSQSIELFYMVNIEDEYSYMSFVSLICKLPPSHALQLYYKSKPITDNWYDIVYDYIEKFMYEKDKIYKIEDEIDSFRQLGLIMGFTKRSLVKFLTDTFDRSKIFKIVYFIRIRQEDVDLDSLNEYNINDNKYFSSYFSAYHKTNELLEYYKSTLVDNEWYYTIEYFILESLNDISEEYLKIFSEVIDVIRESNANSLQQAIIDSNNSKYYIIFTIIYDIMNNRDDGNDYHYHGDDILDIDFDEFY